MHPSQTHVSGAGAVEEQVLYPPADVSRRVFAKPLFDLGNIFDGGYVWLFGMILTGIFYFALTVPQTSKNFLEWLLLGCDSNGNCVGRTFVGYQMPFAKDSDFPGLPPVTFSGGIDLHGFVLPTILLILAMAVLGLAIYLCSRYIKQLANTPLIFDEDITDQVYKGTGHGREINPEEANRLAATQADETAVHEKAPTTYGDLWPVWLCVGAALLLYVGGIWTCVKLADRLHPFGASLLVLVHIIIAAELIVLSVQTSAWLANRTKFEAGNEYSYLPVWFLTVLPCCFAFFGVWIFGSYPGAYLLSDTIFALVFVGVFVALTVLGWAKGGELQRLPGIVGFWHAILQLTVSLLLVRIGDSRAVVGALILILVFSGLSIPKTKFSVHGLGTRLMGLPEPLSGTTLTVMWFVYGVGLLGLPLLFHDRRAILNVQNGHYSSFLPQSLVDWLYQHWALMQHSPGPGANNTFDNGRCAPGFPVEHVAIELVLRGSARLPRP